MNARLLRMVVLAFLVLGFYSAFFTFAQTEQQKKDYVSTIAPEEKMSNWLPAPKRDFSLYVRAYWPQASGKFV